MNRVLPVVGDGAMAVDFAAVASVSLAIVTVADRLVFMTAWVAVVIAARLWAWRRWAMRDWGFGLGVEIAFLAGCALVGGFNDWNTVVRHGVYDYSAPAFFPALTTIPEWMLVFWGLILRSLVTLFRWRRMSPPAAPQNASVFAANNAGLRVGLEFAIIAATRQAVYRWYADPIWSWLPFAAAAVAYVVFLKPRTYELRLGLLFAVAGPLIEAAYIHGGGLHVYRLGWILGVPLWIALWWVLAVLIWSDLAGRVLARLRVASPARVRPVSPA